MHGKPGTIIRVWPLLSGGPGNSDAFRFIYRSTGLKGEIIPVSGAIFIPSGPAPAGGRNVIAWAHPTSGVAPECAPSLYPDRAGLIWNLKDMLNHGYVVVATDYPGLGTEGIHPYLIGESAGRAVLDSVRATQHFSKSGASNRFAVWGRLVTILVLWDRTPREIIQACSASMTTATKSKRALNFAIARSRRRNGWCEILSPVVQPLTALLVGVVADYFHCRTVGAKPVSHDRTWPVIAFHHPLEKLQCRFAVSALRSKKPPAPRLRDLPRARGNASLHCS